MFPKSAAHSLSCQNHPEDIPKNKTQHYSGITGVSREQQQRMAVVFFTLCPSTLYVWRNE